MGYQNRRGEIRQRRTRRQKLAKLRKRYLAAKTDGERSRVLAKVKRVAPSASTDVFLARVAAARENA